MLALGYTGWGPGQLDKEIKNNGWMLSSTNSNFIFDGATHKKWEKAYEIIGVDPYSISSHFGKA